MPPSDWIPLSPRSKAKQNQTLTHHSQTVVSKKASHKHISKLVNGSCHSHTSSLSTSVASPPDALLPSGLEGDKGGDTCTSNLSVSYLLMTPTDYQSLHLTGKCQHALHLIEKDTASPSPRKHFFLSPP